MTLPRLAVLGAIAGSLAFASAVSGASAPVLAELSVDVGGTPMVASKTIVENVLGSKDHTVLVAALEAAGLVETLQGDGPFTLFAPVNKAFARLPKGTLATWLEPDSKEKLVAVLTYHIIRGRFSAADFVAAVEKAGGPVKLETLEGEVLEVTHDGRKLEVIDGRGDKAVVTIPDVIQKNGVVHVVDTVLEPQK